MNRVLECWEETGEGEVYTTPVIEVGRLLIKFRAGNDRSCTCYCEEKEEPRVWVAPITSGAVGEGL